MKIIYNSVIPFKGFIAMLTIFILWVRKEYKGSSKLDEFVLNHEKIHSYQQIEIWVLSIVVSILLSLLTSYSWWMLLATPLIPLLFYVVCWLIEVCLPPYDKAYKNICFETEATYNESDLNYLGKKRKLFQFTFLKYISNNKYPALTALEKQQRKNAAKNSNI